MESLFNAASVSQVQLMVAACLTVSGKADSNLRVVMGFQWGLPSSLLTVVK